MSESQSFGRYGHSKNFITFNAHKFINNDEIL
jgi:hypothetical protein